jgi:hypothetical protein
MITEILLAAFAFFVVVMLLVRVITGEFPP